MSALPTSKNTDPRVLPLVPSVRPELSETRIAALKAEAKRAARKHEEPRDIAEHLVFRGRRSEGPYPVDKPWLEALKAVKVEGFRFHDLRHTAASYLAMSGASPLETAFFDSTQRASLMKFAGSRYEPPRSV